MLVAARQILTILLKSLVDCALRCLVALVVASWTTAASAAGPANCVIQISVDGLGSKYLQALLDEGRLPTFQKLQSEGSWTHFARTDFDYTVTLPNHTSMITGRPVKDRAGETSAIQGHNWTNNSDPEPDQTLHSNRHEYVHSTFDVAHDQGLRTALLPTKTKFSIYDQSYDDRNGAPDKVGEDNGRDKIDVYAQGKDTSALVDRLIAELKQSPIQYVFLHLHDPDSAGHASSWGSDRYNEAVVAVDGYLARLLGFLKSDARYAGKTALIISADHGGLNDNHGDRTHPLIYSIPFYTWGAGVAQGKELYSLNTECRCNPGQGRPEYVCAEPQPIRNGDGGNLALSLLGLPPIPGSIINAKQDLKVE